MAVYCKSPLPDRQDPVLAICPSSAFCKISGILGDNVGPETVCIMSCFGGFAHGTGNARRYFLFIPRPTTGISSGMCRVTWFSPHEIPYPVIRLVVMVHLHSSIFLLATIILAFGVMDSSAAPFCRSCPSAGEVRADGNASDIIVSRVLKLSDRDTIRYVSVFSHS
jgi:hypothetical protein